MYLYVFVGVQVVVVGYVVQVVEQCVDGWFGLFWIVVVELWYFVVIVFVQGQYVVEGIGVVLVELIEVQGGVVGVFDLVGGVVQVEDEFGWDDVDQYQYDQVDIFLVVVGVMDEVYCYGGKYQYQVVLEWWVFFFVEFVMGFWGFVYF